MERRRRKDEAEEGAMEEEEDCLRWKGGNISVISCRLNGLFVFAVLLMLLLLLLLLSLLSLLLKHVHLQELSSHLALVPVPYLPDRVEVQP